MNNARATTRSDANDGNAVVPAAFFNQEYGIHGHSGLDDIRVRCMEVEDTQDVSSHSHF